MPTIQKMIAKKKYKCTDCDYEDDNIWSLLVHYDKTNHGKIKKVKQ